MHDQIVDEILPSFAQKLKVEKVISSYDRTPFKIQLFEDWTHFAIVPDLIVYLPTGEKVLVEVANPKEAKRLIGEMVYPRILGVLKMISAAIIFVLDSQANKKIQLRSWVLSEACPAPVPF